jgi:hypothetical protein
MLAEALHSTSLHRPATEALLAKGLAGAQNTYHEELPG